MADKINEFSNDEYEDDLQNELEDELEEEDLSAENESVEGQEPGSGMKIETIREEMPTQEGQEETASDPDLIPFVHLHVHSHYSLLDGAGKLPALLDRTKELGMDSLALTDHGNLHGMLEFYQKARNDFGMHPVLGYEAYMAPGSRFEKSGSSYRHNNFHLTLLAMDMDGYKNLLKLGTLGFTEGFYYKPRIDKEILKELSKGLICLSGCLAGEFARTLVEGNVTPEAIRDAKKLASWFHDLFGDRYYIELQNHGIEDQKIIIEPSVDIARELGIETVTTNDVHYVRQEDSKIQDLLLCVNTRSFETDPKRMRMETDQFYLKSGREMLDTFPNHENAVRRSVEIAARCNQEIVLGKRFFPGFTPPDGKSSEEYLRELCVTGLKRRYANNPKRIVNGELSEEVMARLNRELGVIFKLGFPNYFLIVWDFVRFAEESGIHRTARGSGVGALVCYALNLSHVCPLEYDLLFERFLDENRLEAPDIDIDFDQSRRSDVLDYVKRKYGENNVAQLGTFGTMAAKMVIKDLGRVLGMPLPQVNEVTALVPDTPHTTIASAREQNPQLEKIIQTDPAIRDLIGYATRLEGLARSTGTHACGVVISDHPLTDFIPLQCMQGNGDYVTQWAAADVEKAGLLKMDFLGLRNLSILANAIDIIEETRHTKINPYTFPKDDKETYELLSRGETKGVFQLESAGIRKLLVKMKPDHFRDIIATLALYRPGPLEGGMVDKYVNVKHGREKPDYIHPVMEEVLGETNGVMVYQEQIMRILNRLGKVPLGSAYTCIKAISKKKEALIIQYGKEFVEGASHNGLTREQATDVFELIKKFARYGFNKSHSTAYALIAYMTAYLKSHYSAEFMAALLQGDISKRNFTKKDSTVEHLDDCAQMKIEIVYPDINVSYGNYRVRDNKIILGMNAIKGVGEDAAGEIVRARDKGGPFKNIFDFYERVDSQIVPRSSVESLIKCGAFDVFKAKRSQLMQVLDKAIKSAASIRADRNRGQQSLFDLFAPEDDQSKEETSAHQLEQAVAGLPEIDEWTDKEKATYEKEVLGFYLTAHPLAEYKKQFALYASHTTAQLAALPDRTNIIIGGMVSNLKITATKKKKENESNIFAIFELEDTEGSVKTIIWPRSYEIWSENVRADNIVLATGHIEKSSTEEGESSITIIADEIFSLSEAEKHLTRAFRVIVDESDHGKKDLGILHSIMKTYLSPNGGLPMEIGIRFQNGNIGILHCPRYRFSVNDEMRRRIADSFGDNAFQLVAVPYKQTQVAPRRSWGRNSEE